MTEHPTDERPDRDPTVQQPAPGTTAKDPLRASRVSRFWLALAGLVVLMLFLVVFVAQNTEKVSVSFLGWQWHTPLAVAMLIAVLVGLAITVTAGTLRIWQVRRRVRRAP
jgi:uncharacterized integral membrane protein